MVKKLDPAVPVTACPGRHLCAEFLLVDASCIGQKTAAEEGEKVLEVQLPNPSDLQLEQGILAGIHVDSVHMLRSGQA